MTAGYGTTVVPVIRGTEPLLIVIGGKFNESIRLLVRGSM
jgi:hypothetical protein